MKRFVFIAAVLLNACSTVQPADPFAHLCHANSSQSCPDDTDAPIIVSGPRNSAVAADSTK